MLKNVEWKDYLQYESLYLYKIKEYSLLLKIIKKVLKENKFLVYKINGDIE